MKPHRIRSQKIRIKTHTGKIHVNGWLTPQKGSYMRFEVASDPAVVDFIDGRGLYRLAKAIVRRWESQ